LKEGGKAYSIGLEAIRGTARKKNRGRVGLKELVCAMSKERGSQAKKREGKQESELARKKRAKRERRY